MNNDKTRTVVCPIFLHRRFAGRTKLESEPETIAPPDSGNIPRVTRLMALAIKLGADLDSGKLTDLADIARCAGITRARATQIMNLLHLAPDIQEALLFLPRTVQGRAAVTERDLREVVAQPDWGAQRRMWRKICHSVM